MTSPIVFLFIFSTLAATGHSLICTYCLGSSPSNCTGYLVNCAKGYVCGSQYVYYKQNNEFDYLFGQYCALPTECSTTVEFESTAVRGLATTTCCLINYCTPTIPILPVCSVPNLDLNGNFSPKKTQYLFMDNVTFTCNTGFTLGVLNTINCTATGKWNSTQPQCKVQVCPVPNSISNGSFGPIKTKYIYQDSVNFTCNTGYTLVGVPSISCTATGNWNSAGPLCKVQVCPVPNSISNGSFVPINTQYIYQDSVNFTCNPGFILVGVNSISCTAMGTWSSAGPQCKVQVCPVPNSISNGTFDLKKTQYIYQDSVTYTCNAGFILVGVDTISCTATGTWSSAEPQCKVQVCPVPNSISNGTFDLKKTQYIYQDSVKYTCNAGFILVGVDTISCTATGTWSSAEPQCKVQVCPVPNSISNGTFDLKKTQYIYQDSVKYTCNTGFILVGVDTISCTATGTWSSAEPQCKVQVCPFPNSVSNGIFDPMKSEYIYQDSVKYTCNPGFVLEGADLISCTASGTWSSSEPQCKVQICPTPNSISNGSFDPMKTEYIYQDSVNFTCDLGFILVGEDIISCTETGTWSSVEPQCNVQVCPVLNSVSNGSFDPMKTKYIYQDSVNFTCDAGFILVGVNLISCTSTGTWSSVEPQCKVQVCPVPKSVSNGSFDPKKAQYIYQDSVKYTCNAGFTLVGVDTISCTATGTWSSAVPECKVQICPIPNSVSNGAFDPKKAQYIYQDSVNFTCNPGFLLVGADSISCMTTGIWSSAEPECKVQVCPVPNSVSNGTFDLKKTQYIYQDSVKYTCNAGFILVGVDTISCTATGTWSSAAPQCKVQVCSVPNSVSNGSFGLTKTQYIYQDSVKYTCNPGFTLVGVDTLYCTATGTWSSAAPQCNVLVCPGTHSISNGTFSPKKTQYGYQEFVKYTCDPGFTLVGVDSIFCTSKGNWSSAEPQCKVQVCSVPNSVSNGSFVPKKTQYVYQDSVKYTCNTGFILVGVDTISCTATGNWSLIEPQCKVQVCPVPKSVSNGTFDLKKSQYVYQDSVKYTCNAGFILVGVDTISCTATGTWSSAEPQCQGSKSCKPPNAIANGSFDPKKTQYVYPDSVKYACDQGFTLLGVDSINCTATGTWSSAEPQCKVKVCPPPSTITNGSFGPKKTEYNYKESVTFTCGPDFSLVGVNSISCTAMGTWSSTEPQCKVLSCVDCVSSISSTCTGNTMTCPAGTVCGSQYNITSSGGKTSQIFSRTCIQKSRCYTNGSFTFSGGRTKIGTSCCYTYNCTPSIPVLPGDSTQSNGLTCPSSTSNNIKCTGTENICLQQTTTITGSQSNPNAFRGCTTQSICDAETQLIDTSQPRTSVKFTCANGCVDLHCNFFIPMLLLFVFTLFF
ncbi:Hypothetical predicted protein [Pelobates cultripes]|uniref:Sushi domain-containing protein n=1 Tax=Pelobates cultripes TaxID=61616 RepID=A0AAD1T4J6_PELCU|nr:Hypothetical predicted protein [Pelobates cultripes]